MYADTKDMKTTQFVKKYYKPVIVHSKYPIGELSVTVTRAHLL